MRWLAVWVALVASCADSSPPSRVCVRGEGEHLRALPADFVDWWLEPGSRRRFVGQVSRSDCATLEGVEASSDQPWLSVEVRSDQEASLRRLVLNVDAAQLAVRSPGVDGHDEALVTVTAGGLTAETRVRVRVIDLTVVHIGLEQGTCRRPGNAAGTCDAISTLHPTWGYPMGDAIEVAMAAHPNGGRFLLYDLFGDIAVYDSDPVVPGDSWISAAPNVPASRVLISEWGHNALLLAGDRIHVERLTIGGGYSMDIGVAAADSNSAVENATRGHLIENLSIYNFTPLIAEGSSFTLPFAIGADTVVRNNYIHGFFGGWMNLRYSQGSRIVGNTFVYYGDVGDPWRIGTSDVIVANNVVVNLARPLQELLDADATSGMTVAGNAVEGYEQLASALETGANRLGPVDLESPRVPLFYLGSGQRIAPALAGEGRSMDGHDLSGRLDLRPGAFQELSESSGPRHELVRVGIDCGEPCDISAAEPDALQMALWSSWPGGTVEVYPSARAYGRVIISWGTTLLGMGEPWEVLVDSEAETDALRRANPPVRAPLYIAPGMLDPVRVSSLTLLADEVGVVHSAHMERASHARHVLERLVIVRDDPSTPDPALYLGHNILVRDTLISGSFSACAVLGARSNAQYYGPIDSNAWLLNITCHLTGYDTELPEAAFWLGGAQDALIANVVVEGPGSVGLFGAQIDDQSDLNLPVRFTAQAISHRGVSQTYVNFSADAAYELRDVVAVGASDAFLAEDGRLEPGAQPIDTGVDPTAEPSLIRFSLELGRALDGVSRAGRAVDRGAFEQGQ